jgi:hypothetical protein
VRTQLHAVLAPLVVALGVAAPAAAQETSRYVGCDQFVCVDATLHVSAPRTAWYDPRIVEHASWFEGTLTLRQPLAGVFTPSLHWGRAWFTWVNSMFHFGGRTLEDWGVFALDRFTSYDVGGTARFSNTWGSQIFVPARVTALTRLEGAIYDGSPHPAALRPFDVALVLVPEPATVTLLAAGALALAGVAARRRRG